MKSTATQTPAPRIQARLRPGVIAALTTAIGGVIVAAITILPDLIEKSRLLTPTPTVVVADLKSGIAI